MNSIRDILERQRAEIRKQIQPLANEAGDLRSKLATIDGRLRTLSAELTDVEKALQVISKREKAAVTIKQAILEVLGDNPNGLSSSEILAGINDRFYEGTLPRTSMSPQLARLKMVDKKIVQRGEKYFLA